ncbi:alternate-type signal peptide domain-containing protein [Leifsonia sp. A12D58]|uniref:alternate-type signal peptide domain-containing protein n=1 Tax=Leifsonia sp. A12D58 TaxID=3397674 RepID=UPI0039E10C14
MNKLIKGSIAGAAGIALLLGGAGTFASWNDSAAVAGGTIVAGNLSATTTTGTWTVLKNGTTTAVTIPDITAFRAVPGDVLAYTSTVAVVASGNNLVARLAIGAASVTATTPGKAADDALALALTKSATLTATVGNGVVAGTGADAGTYTVTAGAAGVSTSVTSTVTLTFPLGAAGVGNAAKLGSVNLANLAVTLTQI